MATYYVGAGGSDGNAGTSWALRKATLNGVEDIPVAANDTVYVGPGTYRETLTIDVAGSSGQPITYIADTAGVYTDGVGGDVIISGSDNDTSSARTYGISCAGSYSYRTFRGFSFTMASTAQIYIDSTSTNWIIEDCAFFAHTDGVRVSGNTATDTTIRRCKFLGFYSVGVYVVSSSGGPTNGNYLIEDCLFVSCSHAVYVGYSGGGVIRNCTMIGGAYGPRIYYALVAGHTVWQIKNSLLIGNVTAMRSVNTGELVEDYCNLFMNGTNYTNVTAGTNSVSLPVFYDMHTQNVSTLNDFMLTENSSLAQRAGDGNTSSTDVLGMPRPSTDARRSWGAFQCPGCALDTATVYSGTHSTKWASGAGYYYMQVPVDPSTSTTISARVRRESGYTGTNPKMIIREAGQSDRVTTDAGSAGAWNQITDTWSTQSTTSAVELIFVCDNTHATDYAAWVDAIEVSF